MKAYLSDFYNYNRQAGLTMLATIKQLPDKEESVKLFSHLINAQNKWYNRVRPYTEDSALNPFSPIYEISDLEHKWIESTDKWIALLYATTPEQLEEYVMFRRTTDGKTMRLRLRELIFQLNCHAIHHRAQINKLISAQGVKVPLTDYIYTVMEVMD